MKKLEALNFNSKIMNIKEYRKYIKEQFDDFVKEAIPDKNGLYDFNTMQNFVEYADLVDFDYCVVRRQDEEWVEYSTGFTIEGKYYSIVFGNSKGLMLSDYSFEELFEEILEIRKEAKKTLKLFEGKFNK
jgi:hypothetical protein